MSKPHHGRNLVIALFFTMMTTSGLAFYNVAVLLSAFVNELSLPVSQVSSAVSFFFISSGISGVVVGRLIEKYPAKNLLIFGAVIGSAVFLSLPLISSLLGVYLFFSAIGAAYAICGVVPCSTLITRWFNKNRPLALATVYNGLSVGGILLTPFAGYLIHTYGFANAAFPIAAFYFTLIALPAFLAVKSFPADVGELPDGAPLHTAHTPANSTTPRLDSTSKEAFKTRFFILITAAYIAVMFAQMGGIAHIYNVTLERVSPQWAPIIVATLTVSAIIGRILGGFILNKISGYSFAMLAFIVQAFGQLAVGFSHDAPSLIFGAVLFGLSLGNVIMMLPLLLAERFGSTNYSKIYSTSQLFMILGAAAGPAVMGAVHDLYIYDGYRIPYVLAAGATLTALCLAALAKTNKNHATT